MITLIEWNYAVVSSHTEFKLRMLVVLDITCVLKCPLSGKTGFYNNIFVKSASLSCLELKHGT